MTRWALEPITYHTESITSTFKFYWNGKKKSQKLKIHKAVGNKKVIMNRPEI